MEIIIQPDADAASRYAAQYMAGKIRANPACVLGLATGGTPERVYAELVRMHREGQLDFSKLTSFNLDEYVGLLPDHEASYHHYMEKHLFNHVNIRSEATYFPDGMADDIPAECEHYEKMIRDAGGIDLQLLGIGRDGHIGFNEPSSSLASRTRIKTLTEVTLRDNSKYFDSPENMPYHVVTMGVGTICDSKTILMLALGESKAQAIADMVEGPITAMVPASILQMQRRVVVVVDEAAATKLSRIDYYRWVFQRKPPWQHVVR